MVRPFIWSTYASDGKSSNIYFYSLNILLLSSLSVPIISKRARFRLSISCLHHTIHLEIRNKYWNNSWKSKGSHEICKITFLENRTENNTVRPKHDKYNVRFVLVFSNRLINILKLISDQFFNDTKKIFFSILAKDATGTQSKITQKIKNILQPSNQSINRT